MRRKTSPGSRPRAKRRSAPDPRRTGATQPCMSTRPRIPSPIRPRRCSRWSRVSRTIRNSCRSARRLTIKCREETRGQGGAVATMTVGYGMIRESFTTQGRISTTRRAHHPGRISRRAVHFLENRWRFQPTGAEAACEVAFYIAYSLPLAPVRAAGWAGFSPRPSTNIRAPSRPAPMRSMGRRRVCSRLTAMSEQQERLLRRCGA